MAYITLPMQEACAVDFIPRSRPKVDLRIQVPLKSVQPVDLYERGWRSTVDNLYRKAICPIIDFSLIDKEALRSKLPYGYRCDDDGVLWPDNGSTVETHYSLSHEKYLRDQEIPDYFSDRNWFPMDDCYEMRGTMLARKQAAARSLTVLNHRGEAMETPTLKLVIPDDLKTVIDTSECVSLSHAWNILVGYGNAPSGIHLKEFPGQLPEPKPLQELYRDAVFKPERHISIRSGRDSKALITHGGNFAKVLRGADEKAEKSQTVGRMVKLRDRDDIGQFPLESIVSTRATGCSGTTNFVAFGITPLAKGFALKPAPTQRHFCMPTSMMLVHKTAEAWRFAFLFLTFFRNHEFGKKRLYSIPVYYMIPQYVHRNEVTFTTKSFRGVGVELQSAIWETEGMSMAISRAFMGLEYEMTKMPVGFAHSTSSMEVMPKNHRIGLLGTGYAGLYGHYTEGKSLTHHALACSMDGNVSDDGPYSVWINGRQKHRFNRAVDLLDIALHGLPDNSLTLGRSKLVAPVAQIRNVRI